MRGMLRSMMTFFAFLAGVFVLLCIFMYLKQDSLIFYPLKNDAGLVQTWQKQRVEIGAGDAAIEGWWMENPQSASSRIILYFGGNGEDVLYTAANSQMLHAARMLVTNYRGYGLRKGQPSRVVRRRARCLRPCRASTVGPARRHRRDGPQPRLRSRDLRCRESTGARGDSGYAVRQRGCGCESELSVSACRPVAEAPVPL